MTATSNLKKNSASQYSSPLTQQEWSQLLNKYSEVCDLLAKVSIKKIPREEKKKLTNTLSELGKEYKRRLPRLPLSRCPICGSLFIRSFDPFGLEGFWWHEWEYGSIEDEENVPKACEHFILILGALNLNELPPKGGKREREAYPGPEVPYVIARILEDHPSRVAVISSISMCNGYTAYPIAYFSEENPPPAYGLTASWARLTYSLLGGWTEKPEDILDFDLLPWVKKGKVKWIEPGDEKFLISDSSEFPYENLAGRQRELVIDGDSLRTIPAEGIPIRRK